MPMWYLKLLDQLNVGLYYKVILEFLCQESCRTVSQELGVQPYQIFLSGLIIFGILKGERVVLPSILLILSSKLGYILLTNHSDPKDSTGDVLYSCLIATCDPYLSGL